MSVVVEHAPRREERAGRPSTVNRAAAVEIAGAGASALALTWIGAALSGVGDPYGLAAFAVLAFGATYTALSWRLHGILTAKDRLATLAVWSGAVVALTVVGLTVVFVIAKGAGAIVDRFPHFLTGDMTQLGGNAKITDLGVGGAIVGTVEQVGIATAITVPLGVLTATYAVSAAGRFARLVSGVVDAMTGAPAIIPGLFIYLLWVVPHHESGKSGLAAALALAVMMLPIVTRAAQEVIAVVPGSLREAALALGAPEWRVLVRVVLPTARAGLATAMILGVARVAGETAPVLFNAGGLAGFNWNPFTGQQDDLPFRIYELIFQPGTVPVQAAWGTSLVLVVLVLALFVVARLAGSAGPGRLRLPALRRRSTPGAM